MRSAQELRVFTADRHHKSLTDELTGLANRRHLYDFLDAFSTQQADVRNPRRSLAFLVLDLNLFKEVNDYFGHLAGDDLLKRHRRRRRLTLAKTYSARRAQCSSSRDTSPPRLARSLTPSGSARHRSSTTSRRRKTSSPNSSTEPCGRRSRSRAGLLMKQSQGRQRCTRLSGPTYTISRRA